MRNILILLIFILLAGCSPEEIEEKILTSGVQYIGDNKKLIAELEKLPIDSSHSMAINDALQEYKLVLIEPNYTKQLNKQTLIELIENGYFIFFINLDDRRLIQEAYFGNFASSQKKTDKIWTEHLYIENEELQSLLLSTDSNIEKNLLKWLKYFDKFKEKSF